jgi:hypothetical protein
MRIPWRTILVWLIPLAAFAWLAVAGRAAPSHPAMPVANSLLGGGAVGARFVPLASHELHFTTVSVPADARVARFYGDWNGRCDGYDGAVTASFYQRVGIADDGTFKGKGPLESTSAEGTFVFSGRFTVAGSAEGTGRVVFTFISGSNRYKCDTGDVSWQVRTSVNRFGRARPAAGRAYFGNTGQRLPMVLRLSRDGHSIEQQAGMWNAKCKKNRAGLGRATSSPSFPIRPDGSFGLTERYTEAYGDFTAHITSTHTGRFGLSTAAGTWRVKVDVRDKSGKRADSCDSGPVRWAVRL